MVLGLHSLLTPSYPPHSCQTNPLKTPIFICNFSKTSFPASCHWKIVSGAFVWHSRLSPSQTFHSCLFLPLHTGSVIFTAVCGVFSCSKWDLVPWTGIEPGTLALGAGSQVLATGPPGKSQDDIFITQHRLHQAVIGNGPITSGESCLLLTPRVQSMSSECTALWHWHPAGTQADRAAVNGLNMTERIWQSIYRSLETSMQKGYVSFPLIFLWPAPVIWPCLNTKGLESA